MIDLRSAHDITYNQGPDPACGYYALANALDVIFERAGTAIGRVSPSYLWWHGRESMGMSGQQVGATFDSLSAALSRGFVSVDQHPASATTTKPTATPLGFGQLVRTNNYSVDGISRLLALGVPLILLIDVYQPFYVLRGDWRKQQWTPQGQPLGMHYVTIVGVDATAGMLLIENSWGREWGDGGFGGIPFDVLPKINQGVQHINWITPATAFVPVVPPDPAQPFGPMSLEALDFVHKSKDYFRGKMADLLEDEGLDAVLLEAGKIGLSDKHIEWLFDLPRYTIRQHATQNPSFAWGQLNWAQL